jgi:hypothetical protein
VNLRLEPACESPGRGSIGSGNNGRAMEACPQGGPQGSRVGLIGIAPIALSVQGATSWRICPEISLRVLGSTRGT